MKNNKIEESLFRHLISNSKIPLIGSVLAGLLVTISHINSLYKNQVICWFFILCLVTLFRYVFSKKIIIYFNRNGYLRSYAIKYSMTLGLSGFSWGLSSLFLFESSAIEMVVNIIAIYAMSIGGALTLGAYLPAFYAFTLPSIIPLVASLVIKGADSDMILAVHSVIFSILIFFIAQKFNRSLKDVLMLTFEKEELMEELEKANNYQKKLANTDGLTGIANRRKFDDILEKETKRFSRTKSPLSLILIDVDYFKIYNDGYGHVAGDNCLKKIANLLDGLLKRSSDLVARYGGEEFAVILPDTNSNTAMNFAEYLRKEVVLLNIKHEFSPIADHVTISAGVYTLCDSDICKNQDLVSKADEFLYKAKNDGRNRIIGEI